MTTVPVTHLVTLKIKLSPLSVEPALSKSSTITEDVRNGVLYTYQSAV